VEAPGLLPHNQWKGEAVQDKPRWLTALIAIPLVLLVVLKGGHLGFVLLLLVVNGMAHWEFLGMFQPAELGARRLKSIILGSVLLISFCTAQRAGQLCNPSHPLFMLVGVLFVLFLFHLVAYGHSEDMPRDLMVNALGFLYVPFWLGHLIWLRYLPQGELWVLWTLAVIFAGDTAAFYGGRLLGKRKLYPEVSPGKTWAGALAGLAGCLLVGVLVGERFLPLMTAGGLAWLSLALGLVGLLGDLFESMLKRQTHVKDAGQILPGHGGMLDRLDSLLFAIPAVVYARIFIFG
jgi:phosphatidate cytidylyltransferase